MKSTIKRVLPPVVLNIYRRIALSRLRSANRQKSPKEVFSQIYDEKKWGVSSDSAFQSGSGSDETMAVAYSDFVNQFIAEKAITSVVDLGCGDFNVGRRLQKDDLFYIGVDIVDKLVEHHNQRYGNRQTSFLSLDIIDDALPNADLCLIRQVLQHLSNQQILTILGKLDQYRYVLISEHYPDERFSIVPNLDKPHGEDIRIYDNSAVYLDKPPFNLENARLVHEIEAPALVSEGEKIRTFLIENPDR